MAGSRLILIDGLRGLALCGMAVFHIDWDLAFLHWRQSDPSRQTGWIVFGHVVASTFLILSGAGLVLAAPRGRGAALRRIGVIAAAAVLVTLVTGLLFAEDVITFGILHCIALANLIALGLVRAPILLVLGLAALIAAVPAGLASHAFDGPVLSWLGLSIDLPRTLDYRPLLPWSALVLLGVALARLIPLRRLPQPGGRVATGLAFLGRHSLLFYLAHQPVLFAILLPLSWIVPAPPADLSAFSRNCRVDCVRAGARPALCEGACGCVVARLSARHGAWPDDAQIQTLGRSCLRGAAADDDQSLPETGPAPIVRTEP